MDVWSFAGMGNVLEQDKQQEVLALGRLGWTLIGVPTYRFLRKYVERRPPVPVTLRQIDSLIRQLSLYRDLVTQKTGGSE